MAYRDMIGPYDLTEENIEKYVEEWIGNYALGYYSNERFKIFYVGRSDTNLNRRLKSYLKDDEDGSVKFIFSYAVNEKEAYAKECRYYHHYKPEVNDIHPDRPDGSGFLKCPICGR